MKAVVYARYGPPDVLHLAEVEKPVPGDSDVLIKVQAAEATKYTRCPVLPKRITGLKLSSGWGLS